MGRGNVQPRRHRGPGLPAGVPDHNLIGWVLAGGGARELVNRLMAAGERQFGPSFTSRINRELAQEGVGPVRSIPLLHLQSSEDIGRLSAAYVRTREFRARRLGLIERVLARMAERESENEADFLSYVLFDGAFARQLIELGRRDARAEHDRIVAFFRAALESRSEGNAA